MIDLNSLRTQFNRREREVLTTIWSHFLKEKGYWMQIRGIHQAGGGKEIVRPILEKFGGSVVYEFEESGTVCYRLTLLGVLLSTEGEVIENMLVRYFELAKILAQRDVKRTHISSKEVSSQLDLDAKETDELGRALFLPPLSSEGSSAAIGWNVELPKEIEDIPDDPRPYIHAFVLKGYDPKVPISMLDRMRFVNNVSAKGPVDVFEFVSNEDLHAIAVLDWAEARLCFEAGAWKACVIACGTVLEAILLDALIQKPEVACEARKACRPDRKKSDNLLEWDLIDLVDAATGIGIIGEATSHLGHANRLNRNLVHPARQIKERVEITKGDAQISLNTVEKCIGDLLANPFPER